MATTAEKSHNEELKSLSRESLREALIFLMRIKDYKKISVTDITEKAGVSRMAYYRHYHSKEEILTAFLDDQFHKYLAEIRSRKDITFYDLYMSFFGGFRENKELIALIDQANLSYLLLERLTDYLTEILKDFFAPLEDSTSEHELVYAAGGLYNLLMHWSRSGMQETDAEMVDLAIKIGWPKLMLSDVDPHSPVFGDSH